jgi:hypothetical protein
MYRTDSISIRDSGAAITFLGGGRTVVQKKSVPATTHVVAVEHKIVWYHSLLLGMDRLQRMLQGTGQRRVKSLPVFDPRALIVRKLLCRDV